MAKNTETTETKEKDEVVVENIEIITKAFTQADIDKLNAIIAQRDKVIAEKDAEIVDLKATIVYKDETIKQNEEFITLLNDTLNQAEKPSFEAQQIKLKKIGLVAVVHRGVVRKSTIGSLNGVSIHDLTDDELDNLEDLDIISDIEE